MCPQLLLCTDLDRTLIPNGPEPESPNARKRFREFVRQPLVTLVYVTGRHLALAKEAIALYSLPPPDFIIGDVGSTIYHMEDNQWHNWQAWQDEISPDWPDDARTEIERLFRQFRDLRLQPHHKQNLYKLSYFTPLHTDLPKLVVQMGQVLENEGINANLISSIDEPAAVGLLDILPPKASKRHAIEFLMAHLELGVEQTIFAGDSGNDVPVLTSPINSILVANADHNLCTQAVEQAASKGNGGTLYCASGNFMEMNGNYSAGILEGIAHYMPESVEWLREI